jgi:hypothetical protein
MKKAEFDQFVDEYRAVHARNLRLSGEVPQCLGALPALRCTEVLLRWGPAGAQYAMFARRDANH